MKIKDFYNLTRETFILQVEGTQEEADKLKADLLITFPKKIFFMVVLKNE